MLSSAIPNVLRSSRGKLSWFQAVVKLSMSGANVHACSSVRQRPCHSIGVWVGSVGSTNMLDSRPGSMRISCFVVPSGNGTV